MQHLRHHDFPRMIRFLAIIDRYRTVFIAAAIPLAAIGFDLTITTLTWLPKAFHRRKSPR